MNAPVMTSDENKRLIDSDRHQQQRQPEQRSSLDDRNDGSKNIEIKEPLLSRSISEIGNQQGKQQIDGEAKYREVEERPNPLDLSIKLNVNRLLTHKTKADGFAKEIETAHLYSYAIGNMISKIQAAVDPTDPASVPLQHCNLLSFISYLQAMDCCRLKKKTYLGTEEFFNFGTRMERAKRFSATYKIGLKLNESISEVPVNPQDGEEQVLAAIGYLPTEALKLAKTQGFGYFGCGVCRFSGSEAVFVVLHFSNQDLQFKDSEAFAHNPLLSSLKQCVAKLS